jgi:O-antigen/teichoic acid export membrane protein
VSATLESQARRGRLPRLQRVRNSKLVRQNLVLFLGGFTAGVGGFVYHSIAGRMLGPRLYGEVAALVALYTVGTAANLALVLVIARQAADLQAAGRLGAIRHVVRRTSRLIAFPLVLFCLLMAAFSIPMAAFLNLSSPVPLIWLGLAIAVYCYTAIPRGVLQGTQRFSWLSANLSLELVVRTGSLVVLLVAGFAVTGSVVAILVGVTFAYGLGLFSLRDLFAVPRETVRMRTMAAFGVTAMAGTIGILLLYNVDVVLAKHYLTPHEAGIYGGLNKIGTIIYYGTLSVSQVLFPRVVEAIATRRPPGRLLVLSGGLMAMLGACAILVFGVAPGLVVNVLFSATFRDAQPYILAVGFIGLGLSLANLLVQFLMATHDRVFIPILGAAVLCMVGMIVLMHDGVGRVVMDVLVTIYALLAALMIRCVLLMPKLRLATLEAGQE